MTLHEDKKKFHSAIQLAAAALKIKPHFVEKDYWICRSGILSRVIVFGCNTKRILMPLRRIVRRYVLLPIV